MNKGKFIDCCTQHYVRTDVLRNLILATLSYTAVYVREHEDDFLEKVQKTSILWHESDTTSLAKQIAKAEKRIAESAV